VEILLTGLARHVWEVLSVTRPVSIAELTRSVGGCGDASSEVEDMLRYLCDLRLVEITDGGEW
jgi:predicted transcriptional regulator